MKVLELKDICKYYKKNHRKLIVLENINYSFEKGKVYAIVGKSGAGKTTLINILGLLKKASKGTIKINDKKVNNHSDIEESKIRNTRIGFVFQSFYLDPLLTAEENILLPMSISKKYSKEEMKNRVDELLEIVDLEERKYHYPNELSGGEQQRIAIARALANDPDIILADEPTGSLDPENEEKMMELLTSLSKKNKCVIIVTHSKTVQTYADIILRIEKHNLVEVKDEK